MARPLPPDAELERAIRAGRTTEVREQLEKVSSQAIPPGKLAGYAALARRSGAPLLAIRWLKPRVYPKPRVPAEATEAERLEYAAALVRLGVLREAHKLLGKLDGDSLPQALFETAAALVSEWRYSEAIPLLERYIAHPASDPYGKTVGLVNLAAAYVFEEDYERSTPLLRTLLHDTSLRRYELLLGNVLQLSAMNFITQGRLSEAKTFLAYASERLKEAKPLDRFLLRKWAAVLALLENSSPTTRAAMRHIGHEAATLGHWETRRDVHRYLALDARDTALGRHWWYGTPYDGFRRRFLREWNAPLDVEGPYDLGGSTKPAKTLVARSGEIGKASLRQFPREHRLLVTLASDFYRPFRVTTLFECLFPDERFLPTTSANRVHQAVRELRRWLGEYVPGVTVDEHQGDYQLSVAEGWAVRVEGDRKEPESRQASWLATLRTRFGTEAFTTAEAACVLGISPRTTLRLLGEAALAGTIERSGRRAATAYRFR